jgi:hypothetical protein
MNPTFARGAVASLLVLLSIAGCGGDPDPGTAHLAGTWNYSYTASEPEGCTIQPELVPGLGAGGRLDLAHWGPVVSGRWEERGGLQTCGLAADWADGGTIEATISGKSLEFEIRGNHFSADLPSGDTDVIEGTVTCSWGDDGTLEGTWRMTRL